MKTKLCHNKRICTYTSVKLNIFLKSIVKIAQQKNMKQNKVSLSLIKHHNNPFLTEVYNTQYNHHYLPTYLKISTKLTLHLISIKLNEEVVFHRLWQCVII